jgi:hypothetical protein
MAVRTEKAWNNVSRWERCSEGEVLLAPCVRSQGFTTEVVHRVPRFGLPPGRPGDHQVKPHSFVSTQSCDWELKELLALPVPATGYEVGASSCWCYIETVAPEYFRSQMGADVTSVWAQALLLPPTSQGQRRILNQQGGLQALGPHSKICLFLALLSSAWWKQVSSNLTIAVRKPDLLRS